MCLQEKDINVLKILFPDDWEHRELNFPFLNAVLNYYERHQSLPEDQSTTTNVVPDPITAGCVDSTIVESETFPSKFIANHSDSIAQDSFLPHLYPPFVAYNIDNSKNYTIKDSFLPELYPPFCAYNDNGNYDFSLSFLLPEYSNDFFFELLCRR